jgi:hypothetical protein
MVEKRPKRRLKVVKWLAPDSLSSADLEAVGNTLARLVALAFRADHPELFGSQQGGTEDAPAVRLPIHAIAQQPVGAKVVLDKMLKCAPRGQAGSEWTFAGSD